MNNKIENKTYKVAAVHGGNKGITVLEGKCRTLREAEESARYLRMKYTLDNNLNIVNFVAFNTHALTINPPYSVDMDAEWSYVVEHNNDTNKQIGGSI